MAEVEFVHEFDIHDPALELRMMAAGFPTDQVFDYCERARRMDSGGFMNIMLPGWRSGERRAVRINL